MRAATELKMKHDARTRAAIDAGHPEWAMLPASWSAAKALMASGWPEGMPKQFFTGKPCRKGHVSVRHQSARHCNACDRAACKSPYHRKYIRGYENTPEVRAKKRVYEKTPGPRLSMIVFQAHRRALKLQATPRWLTAEHKAAMRAVYEEAARMTKATGIPHHVDHIVPLKATCPITRKRNASGLHIPANLQIIPAADNLSKNCWFDGGW